MCIIDSALRAEIPIAGVEILAADSDIRFIYAKVDATTSSRLTDDGASASRNLAPMAGGVNVSQGVVAHQADLARTLFGIDGSGVRVGVLSDSVDFLASVQASGDLPPVTVLPGQSGVPGSGEGTAMLEIVHDIAPGAELYFATAFESDAGFAQNIRDLAAAGCAVIVDDVAYFNESPFQDGPIARAVNDVTAAGVLYFSSAGNEGGILKGTSGVYEGDFVDAGALALVPGGVVNLFDDGVTSATNNLITAGSGGAPVTLFWSDPAGASGNDYDLFVLNAGMTAVVSAATNVQDGNDDPYEATASSPSAGTRLVILKKSGAADRFLHLNTNRGRLAIRTSGQTGGHAAAAEAYSVAAVDAATAAGGAFTGGPANPVESFSSDGPRRVFFNPDGSLAKPDNPSLLGDGGIVRQKPDIAAADGVACATPGFNPFYGTSAAAPHAAAIGALLLAAVPSATVTQIRGALTSTALDIEESGPDINAGAGIVMAPAALAAIGATPMPRLVVGLTAVTEVSGLANVDGTIDPGETLDLVIHLSNAGGAVATAVSGVLSTSTTGMAIVSDSSTYPDLGVGAVEANTIPFRLALSPDAFVCGTRIDLYLTVQFAESPTPSLLAPSIASGRAGAPASFTYPGPPIAIPDGAGILLPGVTVSIPLTVTGISSAINDLSFHFDGTDCTASEGATTVGLDHTFVGDLVVELVSPDGTSVRMINRLQNGAGSNNGNNFCNTVLTDAAEESIQAQAASAAPFTGTFRPGSALSGFTGQLPDGTWQLRVTDFYVGDTGSVREFGLDVTPSVCSVYCGELLPADVALPDAQFQTLYGLTFALSTGGSPVFAATAPLPDGLSLSPDGVLSGTPAVRGSFSVEVQAATAGCKVDRSYTLNITGGIETTTALTSSGSPTVFSEPVTLTATVIQEVGSVVPTGSVEFFDDTTSLGTSTLDASGVCALVTSTLSVGTHAAISAVYSGDSTNAPSTSNAISHTVDEPVSSVTGILPGSRCQGSDEFTLTLSGVALSDGMVVRWNGADRPTTFVDTTTITAAIAAGDLTTVGPASVQLVSATGTPIGAEQPFLVTPDTIAPLVTAPARVDVVQTYCIAGTGVTDASRTPEIATFLAGAIASDDCSTPIALAPRIGDIEVTSTTPFVAGPNTVSFRFVDGAGNSGSATSTVFVHLAGDLDDDGDVDSADAVILRHFLVGNLVQGPAPFDAPLAAADLDRNGQVNAVDSVLLANHLAGNIGCLPR
ncbi:MAG: Ig-like domain repeat protein, partial [Thermoanaerobaculia bacterium]